MTDHLISVDPGKHKYGWAYFVDGTLVDCGHQPALGPLPEPFDTAGARFVFEHPKVYPHGQGAKTNPNDLFGLVWCLGRIQGMVEGITGLEPEIETVFPRGWKGQTPKDIQNKRDMAKLEEHELACVPNNHNVKDAVGIGLWALGRKKKQ